MTYIFDQVTVAELNPGKYLLRRLERIAEKNDFDLFRVSCDGESKGCVVRRMKQWPTESSVYIEFFSGVSAKEKGEILFDFVWFNHPVVGEKDVQSVSVDNLGEGTINDLLSSLQKIGFRYFMSLSASYGSNGYYTDLGTSVILHRELPEPEETLGQLVWSGLSAFSPSWTRIFSRG